jgi:hypothetical protein
MGTAIAGTILIAAESRAHPYAIAMGSLALFGLAGLGAAFLIPSNPVQRSD